MRLKNINTLSLVLQLLILCSLSFGVLSISNKVLYPVSSNLGFKTDYYMSFTPDLSYSLSDLNIKLSIPIQYDLAQITNDMECYMSPTGKVNTYSKMSNDTCYTQPYTNTSYSIVGSIIIKIDGLSSIAPLSFVFRNILNPTADSSSYFGLQVRSGTHLLESDKQFKMLTFTPYFALSPTGMTLNFISGVSITTNPQIAVAGQGTTYFFKFKTSVAALTSTYNIDVENMEIRVVFPQQYSSTNAICSLMKLSNITGTYSTIQVETASTPSKSYSIECKKILNLKSSYIYLNLTDELYLKIQNIENPLYSDTFNNFYIQISRGGRNQIIEQITFPSSIQIQPQQFDGQVKQTNMMRNATIQYFFYFTHDLDYSDNSKIVISIGNSSLWTINEVKLMFGFTNPQNFTSVITNSFAQSSAEITNFGLASKELQQIISLNLTSSDYIGYQQVKIQSFINGKLSGTWSGIVTLNSTWGSFNRLHFSAVQQPIKLPVGKTGPLQFTLFLNYQLPQSQNIQNGSMIISFKPPIATPNPDIYGKIKCYFKATIQAADCIYDNSDPTKTKITIVSPPYQQFQYSQIPITITTEGGIDQDHEGFTISPIVQRYIFDVEFYLYNSSLIPSEVLYTNWLADAIQLPGTLTAQSLSWQCNQLTALHFNLITPPFMTTPQERMVFVFMPDASGRSAWDPTLGYGINKVYKEFPCVVVGLPGLRIKCDLYTYINQVSPYNKLHINSNSWVPYITVYGFTTPVPAGLPVQIYLPGIKLSSNFNAGAVVSFSILQETPDDTQPYIELYHQNITIFNTIASPTISPSASITNSPPQIQVQTSNLYSMGWNPVSNANVAFIRYDFTQQLPSMDTLFGTCSGTCYSSGYPNNWIVEIPSLGAAGSITSPHTLSTNHPILSMPYINSLVYQVPVRITTYSATGNTLQQIDIINEYIPQPITGVFNLLDPTSTIYAGLKQWYQIDFTTSLATTSQYPFIKFKLSPQLRFADPPQCSSTTILAFNETGIQCILVPSTNNQQLFVYNIQNIVPGLTYSIQVRLKTTANYYSTPINPTVDVYVHHNQSIANAFDQCFVEDVVGVSLIQAQTPIKAGPQQFTISNPQILNEQIRVNYIGRLFIDFQSSASLTTNLKLTFPNHRYNTGFWSTQNGPIYDPMVCIINGQRFYCQQTYGPLTVVINSAQIASGLNRLQLDTEYVAPYNGIFFPTFAGNYEIDMSTIDPLTNVETSQHSFYAFIHPPQLDDIEVASIVRDINTESVYLVNFTINSTVNIPLANHAINANYSRIFIEFPTIVNGQTVFLDNLGGYQGVLNERVGCSFLKGAQYVVPQATNWLQCRLIPPQIPGAPVKVQVVNFAAFSASVNSLGLFIFKIWNPAAALNSFQITVKINNYGPTGQVFPIFESDYIVFLDPQLQNPSPTNYPSSEGELTSFFAAGLDVGDTGTIQMKAQTINPIVTLPFYMLVKLPQYLPIANEQLSPTLSAFTSCPPSNFQYCVSSPDVNYALVKAIVNQSFFTININDYPLGISQNDSYFYSMIIESGRWTGNLYHIISQEKRWLDIRGALTFGFIQPVGLLQKADILKQRFHVAIQFTTKNYIPQTGTIEINFPSSVTKIYPYCRSAFANGSSLISQSGNSGQVGCDVQNTNKWVITGFTAVQPLSTIMISGYIDLPSVAGTLGQAEIITYADNDPTDIHTNGSQIDYCLANFNLYVQNVLAMNPNQNVFLTQRDVVRANDIADFRILFRTSVTFSTTGYMSMDFSKNDINGQPGGFSTITNEKKVCEFIDITTQNRIGCQVTSELQLTSAGQSYIRLTMITFEDLLITNTYQLRLTTQKYSYPITPEGIRYPTVPSTYKVETNIKYSASSPQTTNQQLYIDVYGPEFTYLKVTQYNYLQNQYNPYWFEIQPSVTITTKHQIIIEFPTKSNDGVTNLFTYNLGLTDYKNGNQIAMDIFDTTVGGVVRGNDFMKCCIHHGSQTLALPVKVVCGGFLVDITSADTLRFAIAVNNPIITGAQVSIPLLVYSHDPYLFRRTQFNMVNGAGYIFDKSNILSKLGFPSTTSMQQQTPNDNFLIGDAHTNALLVGDAFVIKFGFPIRVNGKVTGGCVDAATQTIIYGDAYYHDRLRTIVCKLTATLPAQLTPAVATLAIKGFYTPWYFLTLNQQKIYAIAHYYSVASSEVVLYTDSPGPFPNFPPRWQFAPPALFTMAPVLGHNTLCQRDDYIFTVQLETTLTAYNNLQYTKLVGIVFPLQATVDYAIFSRNCIEHPLSDIEVILCEVDDIARTIYIEIVPGVYSNNKKIIVQTKGLAIRNPCVIPSSNLNQFTINFFSWQNITVSDQRANNRVYMTLDSRNLPSTPLTFINQVSNAANNYFYPFDWVDVPNEKYFNEFLQFKSGQYSPFKFDLMLTTAISAQALGSYNTLTLYYGPDFDIPSPQDQYIQDMKQNTQLCYLRNTRVAICQNDFVNKKITMFFQFDLPLGEWINIYFSIQNPIDLEINGFRYIGSYSDVATDITLELNQYNTPTYYHFKVNPFEAKQTNFNPATTTMPERSIINGLIDYANSLTSQLNVIDITLSLNTSVSDIKGLKFQIPLVDQFGVQIFSNPPQTFMNLEDGDEYPCGNNDPTNPSSGKAKCYLFHGDNTNMGQPATIIMTDFVYTTQIKARLLLKNPDAIGKWVTINVKAYKDVSGGGQTSLIGHQYVGYWRFPNIFKTVDSTGAAVSSSGTTSTTYLYPSNPTLGSSTNALYNSLNPLWMDTTTWVITGTALAPGVPVATNQYVIFQAYLNNYNLGYVEPQFCKAAWSTGNTQSDDMIVYKSREPGSKFQKVFFIKKWTGVAWSLSYFKCKHYLTGNEFKVYYHGSKILQSLSIYTVPYSTFDFTGYTTSTIKYYEMTVNRVQVQIDITTSLSEAIARGLNWENQVNYVMTITTDNAIPFTGISACYAMEGFVNLDGKTVNCRYIGTNKLIIEYFSKILTDQNGLYTVRVDIAANYASTIGTVSTTASVMIYAGPQAFSNNQNLFQVNSAAYSRSMDYWTSFTVTCIGTTVRSPVWTSTYITAQTNYYSASNLNVALQHVYLSTTVLELQIKVTAAQSFLIQTNNYPQYVFRFYLQGINEQCGSVTLFNAQSSAMGSPVNLISGARCSGKNYIIYQSYLAGHSFSSYGLGSSFGVGQYIVFNIQMSVTATDPSWTRDWVAVKVFLQSSYIQSNWNTCCCCLCTNYDQYFNHLGYGEGFYIRQQLFTNGVDLNALSNLANTQTQLEVVMRNSYVPINPTTTNKLLMFEFNTGSTTLFNYINATTNVFNYAIECNCLVSQQPDFSGATTYGTLYNNLECYLKFPQGNNIYTAISVNLNVPVNNYAKCYFPGFISSATSLTVIAKLANKGVNQANYPTQSNNYGSVYQTLSSTLTFISGSIANSLSVNQTPQIYDGTTPVTIKTSYTILGTYTLTVDMMNPGSLITPIFYVNFQKGGPVPDSSLCSATFSYCRIYSKYRNIMVAKYNTAIQVVTFSTTAVTVPLAKQPNLGSDYNMLVYVKDQSDTQYTFTNTYVRNNPDNLVPSSTTFTVAPQRLTSNNYETFTSNLILSFKLEGNALTSYWTGQSKIQISYDQAAYLSADKGCTVSTDDIADDNQFSFYCEVDSTNQIVRIQNRYFNNPFSVGGLIQVVVGVVNQAATAPVKFTLNMYKWWTSSTDYGLVIQSDYTYTPFSLTGGRVLQSRSQIRQYPFYTKFFSDVYAPFRMTFKFPPTMTLPISYLNDATTFMILDNFDGIATFAVPQVFECYLKEFTGNPPNTQPPQTNGYRNYKQNTQYFFVPTYCTYLNTTALRIQIPRNRDLDNTKYYQLVVLPISSTMTGFNNVADPLAKLVVFPANTAQHIFEIKQWTKYAFNLASLWIVTTKPLEPNALQLSFSTNFSSNLDFPNHYIEIVFNNLDLTAIASPYNQMGQTVPCSFSAAFGVSANGIQQPNCIVTYADYYHQVIKIRVQNFKTTNPNNFLLSFDYFFLPSITGLLQQSNTFTVCMKFWSAAASQQRCFGQIFIIDGYTNPFSRNDLTTATFLPLSELRYGAQSSPVINLAYPKTTTSQRDQKVMIKITGGYSAVNTAPLSFSGSGALWYNPMINLYIRSLGIATVGSAYNVVLGNGPGLRNPFPYEMEEYMLIGNTVQMTFFNQYYPNTKYTLNQPPYSSFVINMNSDALVRFGTTTGDDIKVSTNLNSDAVVKLSVSITQTYANLALHENNRFEIQFVTNVTKVKRCWVNTVAANVEYSDISVCMPKGSDPLRLQLLNFYSANTNNNLIVYALLQLAGNNLQMKSHLYAMNDQQEFQDTKTIIITQVISMPVYTDLSWTESHYMPGYYQQIITPITHTSPVEFMYFSMFIPQDLVQISTVFTILLNSTLTIQPTHFAASTRLICQWMKVNKYGRTYETGKFSYCVYSAPNIVINAPLLNLPQFDASGNRIPYLLKIREQSPTGTQFNYPTTSQVQEIILQSATGGNFKKDTLTVHPYQFFNGLLTKPTTLTFDQLNTFTVQFGAPSVAVGAGTEYVMSLEFDSKYLPDTLGVQDIYNQYGDDSTNSTIVNNLQLNMVYKSLPNKWINGIPYSCWTSQGSAAEQTCVQKSAQAQTIKINLLLATYTTNMAWKIPLLKNPSTSKPYRMNLTLWSYPAATTQGHKELFYEIINEHITQSSTITPVVYDISAAAQASNRIQTSTNSMNVQFATYIPTADDIIELKILARAVGMINIPSFLNPAFIDTTYNFFFFKNLNFLIAQRLNLPPASNIINIGSIEVSNQFADDYGYQWLKIHSASSRLTVKANGQVIRMMPQCTIPTISYTLMSGKDSIQGSNSEVKFAFTTPCNIPANSTLKMIAATTDLQFLNFNDQTYCETTFRSRDCWIDSSLNLFVRFDDAIASSTVMSITTFVRAKSRATTTQIWGQIYAIPQKTTTLVNSITPTNLLPATSNSLLTSGSVFPLLVKPLYENTYSKMTGTFTPGHLPFTFVELISPFPKLMTSNETFYYQANTTGSPYTITQDNFNLRWIRTKQTMNTIFDSTQTIFPDGINLYGIVPFTQYRFNMGSMYETTADLDNFLIGPVGAYYQFEYHTDVQIAYHQVYPVPVAQVVTVINPLTQVGQQTVIGIQFTSALQDILPGDRIEIQLDSYNLIEDMYIFTNDQPQCIQYGTPTLTSNPSLVCEVAQYPDSSINQPLLINVYPTNTVTAGTPMEIWISPVINSPNILVAGVTVKVLRFCSGQQFCTMYEGRGWYQTTNSMIITNYGTNGATMSPNPTTVLETGTVHTYTFNPTNLQTTFIKYPQNYDKIMTSTCVTGGTCIVFPKQRNVVTIQAGTSTSSLTINGMTNGIYIVPQQLIEMRLASGTNLDKYTIIHPPLTERTVMPLLANALNTFTITNTQNSGQIFLRNYWNTVKMEIQGLYTSQFIKAFYIVAPVQVTEWDNTYCNATIGSPLQLPYPTRLECLQITPNTIQIKIPQGVSYQPGISENQLLTVHAKFWLQDFPPGQGILYVSQPITSGLFNAYGSFSDTSFSTDYDITKVTTSIPISQHRTPLISQVAFNTESFEQRMASINEQTTFDILIDPLTTDHVKYIELIIPEEFKYPNVLNHDMCQLIYQRTTDLTSCIQTRRDNQTIITIDIDQINYDDGPRILRIASTNMSDWFTAPSIPGSLYNMTISLYGSNGQLLQKQSTKNSSRIKGLELKVQDIIVQNGHDQLQEQIYDITFTIGTSPIKQGYRGILSTGDYYSSIRINFETVQGYEYLLGGYYNNLDKVGCVTSLMSINREITCIFDMGTDINDEPTIIVSNYEQIAPNSTIKLSFANIKNLPSTLRNTIGISVKYYKVGDSTPNQLYSYMMYDHEEAITDATTALSFTLPTSLTLSYTSQTIVNQPTTFQVIFTPSVSITSYILVKFPKDGLRDEYQRFNVQCSNSLKVQVFYRAQVLRIYPLGGTHAAGISITYTCTGFPSTEYVVINPAYPITLQAYSGLKIVHRQVVSVNLNMQGCKLNSGIIASTSPYGGDTGVSYTFEAQVNVSQLTRSDEPIQLNMMIGLPNSSAWFLPSSSCYVDLPLVCSIDTIQKRIVIKNLIQYTKSSVLIKTYDIINPSAIANKTNLTFTSSLFEETTISTTTQQNTICLGSFSFTYLPSPPNQCTMTLTSQHQSTIKSNILSFGIVCGQAIRNLTVVYMKIPSQMRFNNLINNTYTCWTDDPSILLDNRCQIVFINGTFYMKTMGQLNIASNILEIKLNVVVNNPLSAGIYWYGSTLQLSGNFYSITNIASLSFYSTPSQPQLNTSISLFVIPKQAGAQAIYVVRVPTQVLSDKLQLNFGSFGVQLNANTQISYYQSSTNSTSTNNTDWLDSQSYFSLLQNTYANSLSYTTNTMSDFSQNINIDTTQINASQIGWTYIMLSPIINPSSSSSTDNLTLNIFDSIQANSTFYNTLVSQQTIPMNLNIENPPANIYQTQYFVIDNDVLSSTIHNISFTLDHKLFTNQNGVQSVEFVIDPPITNLAYIPSVQACFYYPDPNTLVECQPCKIGLQQLSFKPLMTNLSIDPQISFTLVLKNLTNPENETYCSPQVATLKDYLASWFQLKIFVDQKLGFQSVYVSMIDDSNKPCVQFKSRKGDILNNLMSTIPAGFETPFNISITQATANLRVFLTTNDSDLTFSTNVIYFNSYDIMSIQLMAIASSNSANKSVEVNITHQQTNALNSFREPQPFVVKIVTGNKETVTVNEMQSASVGYDIRVPVVLSKPSLNNMSLLLTISNSTSLNPYLNYFTITPLQLPIPSQTSSTYFNVRYNGTKVPPTLNISLKLISQNTLTHYLLKEIIYLTFTIDPKYQTLPPIMKMNALWSYKSNNDIVSKIVYYCCNAYQSVMTYDYLKPVIIDNKTNLVTATKAQISIWTRNEATLFYQLREKGNHFDLLNKTSTELRQNTMSLSSQTFRNSSNIVNAYQTINFTNLEHQTDYYLFVSAFDPFGDSENVTIITIKTGPLSSAIKFNLNCFDVETDDVMNVRALADILKIDMRRIKVVSSYKILQNTFISNADNKPIYSHEIVISPSLTDDSMSPEELFKTQLLNNSKNQGFLKEKIPSWTGYFDPISKYQVKKPYYQIDKYRSQFKQAPYAQRISYYNVTIGVKFWTKARVSAVIFVQQGQTPDNSIDFINQKPIGKKINQLSSTQQQLSPNSKQICKGLNQFNQKLAPKFTFTGLTNEDGQGIVFFKGLKPGSYCKVYITSTNPEIYEPTASLLDAQVYVIKFNMMWNPNLKGDDHLILNQLSKKNPQMYEAIKQYYDNQNNNNKKAALKKN